MFGPANPNLYYAVGYQPQFEYVDVGADPFAEYQALVSGEEDEVGYNEPYYMVGDDGELYGPFPPMAIGAGPLNVSAYGRAAGQMALGQPRPGSILAAARRRVPVPAVMTRPAPRPVMRVPVSQPVMRPVDREARRQFWQDQQERLSAAKDKWGVKAIRVLGLRATTTTIAGASGTAQVTPAISGPVVAIVAPQAIAEDFTFDSLTLGIQPISANGGPFSAISFSSNLNRSDLDPFDGISVIAGTPVTAAFTNDGVVTNRMRANVHIIDETSGPIRTFAR